jgi:multicomponent Na+:H+ antiporter subunit F
MAETLLTIAFVIIALSALLALVRFAAGPTSVDRVIAFDVLTIISIGIIVIIAHLMGRVIYLDVAIVYGLLSFLGVVVVARYLEKGL